MPHKGILTCTYRSTAGSLQHWVLRMALTQVGGRKTMNGVDAAAMQIVSLREALALRLTPDRLVMLIHSVHHGKTTCPAGVSTLLRRHFCLT